MKVNKKEEERLGQLFLYAHNKGHENAKKGLTLEESHEQMQKELEKNKV